MRRHFLPRQQPGWGGQGEVPAGAVCWPLRTSPSCLFRLIKLMDWKHKNGLYGQRFCSFGVFAKKGMFLCSLYPWELLSGYMFCDSLRQTALQGVPSSWGHVQLSPLAEDISRCPLWLGRSPCIPSGWECILVATPMQLKPWPSVKYFISLHSINRQVIPCHLPKHIPPEHQIHNTASHEHQLR